MQKQLQQKPMSNGRKTWQQLGKLLRRLNLLVKTKKVFNKSWFPH